jgi:SprT-like family protein
MREVFEKYVPTNSIDYCVNVSSKYDFELNLSFNRKSKFGHYKYWPLSSSHTISINKGLSQPLFLITFIHELAHLDVMLVYGQKVKPHGLEWKRAFRKLLAPLLSKTIFETTLLAALANHLKSPKASLSADPVLWNILFHDSKVNSFSVKDIEVGNSFIFKNRVFKKIKTRRTRALCYESRSGNNYLIPLLAKIDKVSK